MPTILRGGFEVRIFTNDHTPGGTFTASKLGMMRNRYLRGRAGPSVDGNEQAGTAGVLALFAANLSYLQAEWNRIHGPLR